MRKVRTILPQDGSEAEVLQLRSELGRGKIEDTDLHAPGETGDDANDEQPQSIPITVVPALVRIKLRERIHSLAKHDAEARVDGAVDYAR